MSIQYKEVSNPSGYVGDDVIDAEETLMARLFRTEAAYRDALIAVGNESYFYHDRGERVEVFNEFTHDNSPDPDCWNEKIAGLR